MFIRIYSQSCWYLQPNFVSCCPSNLLFGWTPPPLPCVNTVYTCTVCNGGGGPGRQTDKHLPLSPSRILWEPFINSAPPCTMCSYWQFHGTKGIFLKSSRLTLYKNLSNAITFFTQMSRWTITNKYKGRNVLPEYRNVCLAGVPPQCQYSSRASLLQAAIARKK